MYNNFLSSSCKVISGVTQGSLLGPILFIIYINDLPSCLLHSNPLLFADDCKIFLPINDKSDCEKLNSDLDSLSKWCSTWLLNLNIEKCNILSFTRKTSPTIFPYQ